MIEFAIIGVPERAGMIEAMKLKVPQARVFLDPDKNGIWWNWKRAMVESLARKLPETTHIMVLQDDLELCSDFLEVLPRLIKRRPNDLISLFAMSGVVEKAVSAGVHWAKLRSAGSGQAIIFPLHRLVRFLAWCEVNVKEEYPYDDARIALWLAESGGFCYVTAPSLVQHLGTEWSAAGLPTKPFGRKKVSRCFVKGSPLSIDWNKGLSDPLESTKAEYLNNATVSRSVIKGSPLSRIMRTSDHMKYFSYGRAGDRYPMEIGDVWELGPHTLVCGDLQAGYGSMIPAPDMVYVDPPYNVGLAKGYRTKAGVPNPNMRFEDLIGSIMEAVRGCKGDVYMESGTKEADNICSIMDAHGCKVYNRWNVTYYKKNPAVLIRGSFTKPTKLSESPEGMDDEDTPTWAIAHSSKPGDLIVDTCTGQGNTAVSAHKLGRRFFGTELNPRRLAVTIEKLVKLGCKVDHFLKGS